MCRPLICRIGHVPKAGKCLSAGTVSGLGLSTVFKIAEADHINFAFLGSHGKMMARQFRRMVEAMLKPKCSFDICHAAMSYDVNLDFFFFSIGVLPKNKCSFSRMLVAIKNIKDTQMQVSVSGNVSESVNATLYNYRKSSASNVLSELELYTFSYCYHVIDATFDMFESCPRIEISLLSANAAIFSNATLAMLISSKIPLPQETALDDSFQICMFDYLSIVLNTTWHTLPCSWTNAWAFVFVVLVNAYR